MEKIPNDIPKPNKENTIPLGIAKSWAKRWRNTESSYNKYHECKAFNIPKIDLQEVLAEEGVESIRAYIGVEKKENPKSGKPSYEEKLMIVGVNAQGKDMITTIKDSNGNLISDPNSEGDIFDFTDPCPDYCDPDSPLNG